MARVFVKPLACLAALLTATLVPAQDTQDVFQEGVKQYRLGNLDEAKMLFQQVLASDPSHEDAFALFKTVDAAVWQALLLETDDFSKMAQHLMQLARVGRAERSRDADAIADLVELAVSAESYGDRHEAMLRLVADHAEFAVPALAQRLGDADDDKGQIQAQIALERIGRAATLPLVELLASDNDALRRGVVAALGGIKDERAVPALRAVAESDSSDGVKMTAQMVLQRMGATGSAAEAYAAQAAGYLSDSGVRAEDRSDVVWRFADGELVARDVPASVYSFELAKNAAHHAVAMQPRSADANVLLARAYLGEAAAIEESLAASPDSETLAAWDASVPMLKNAAAATGVDVIRRAVTDSLAARMAPMAIAGIELLAEMENRADLASSPLVAAVRDNNKQVAYAAALALAQAGGPDVPAAGNVVAKLAEAVTEETLLNVKVIDGSPVTQKAVANASLSRGTSIGVADTALEGLDDLFRFPNVDVVVINENMSDALPDGVIGLVRNDERLARAKILLISDDPDAAAERYGDRIDGTIKGPVSADGLQQAVVEALADVDPDATRARASEVAQSASQALESLAAADVDVGAALANLAGQLNRDDLVAVPAARALGFGGSIEDVSALLGAVNGDGSDDLKVACADAIGMILGRASSVTAETFDAVMAVATSDASIAVKSAAVRALGKASVTPELKLKLIQALRVEPAANDS